MPDRVGDLAVVLHSHMPYVEGFGTWPFGEEWLFDAFARSHVPVLDATRDMTVTITPVLADQLEDEAAAERMRAFMREHRLGAAERDAADAEVALRPAAEAEAAIYRRALERLDALEGRPLGAFAEPHAEGRVELMASAATHAVLPLVATAAGRRLQIDAGLRSHSRRFGRPRGFWLPECAYRAGLDALLAERGLSYFCADQSDGAAPLEALTPVASPAGPIAFGLDWDAIAQVWSPDGYPSDPAYLEYHRQSINGMRLWSIAGEAYDPVVARRRAAEHAATFADVVAARLREYAERAGRAGLVTFAIDTELLGAWWTEGPEWLRALADAAPQRGVRLVTLSRALDLHEPAVRELRDSTWGQDKDFSTWDSPAVADLAWGARRLELRLLRELSRRSLAPAAAKRAARELLAVQSSDWAFLDTKRQAGEYPYQRAIAHAEAMHEVIDSREAKDSRMRSLAPDLSIAPLLEP
jgi:1,4-alpha-glucan branching enzyme